MIGGGGTVGTQVTGNVVARIGHTLGALTDNQCIYTTESHTSILNNIVFDCHKYAIQVYSALPGGSTYNIIANNTILASFRGIVLGGENIGSGPPAVDYNTVINNIVYGMSSFGFHVVGIFGPHNVTSNNLTYRNGENYSHTYIARTSEIVADPLFVAYTGGADGDYHLQPRSPAIGAGTSVGAPLVDFEAKPRRRTPSVGAYEFQQRFTR